MCPRVGNERREQRVSTSATVSAAGAGPETRLVRSVRSPGSAHRARQLERSANLALRR